LEHIRLFLIFAASKDYFWLSGQNPAWGKPLSTLPILKELPKATLFFSLTPPSLYKENYTSDTIIVKLTPKFSAIRIKPLPLHLFFRHKLILVVTLLD